MVDVRVGFLQTPNLRVFREVLFHVFVDFFLQVDTEFPVRADDDIGTHAMAFRDVAVRVRNLEISRVVNNRIFRQRNRRVRQPLLEVIRVRLRR